MSDPAKVGVGNDRLYEIDWSSISTRADPAGDIRRGLDRYGFVRLRGFASIEDQQIYVQEFDESASKASSSAGIKYSLKYDQIEHHNIVARARSQDLLDLVNGISSSGSPLLKAPLKQKNVQIGYSILKNTSDFVNFHFDTANFINMIVPIRLPETDIGGNYLWSLPNVLGPKMNTLEAFKLRAIPRLANSPAQKFFRFKRCLYSERDAILFYGHRSLHGVFNTEIRGTRAIASINYRWPT